MRKERAARKREGGGMVSSHMQLVFVWTTGMRGYEWEKKDTAAESKWEMEKR